MSIFVSQRLTQFSESDAAGVIHFSNYAKYVEECEHMFLFKQGFAIQPGNLNSLLWPRLTFKAEYLRAIMPLEMIQVELDPARVGHSSITWSWAIWNSGRKEKMAQGEMKTVCCKAKGGKMHPIQLPEELRIKLNPPV